MIGLLEMRQLAMPTWLTYFWHYWIVCQAGSMQLMSDRMSICLSHLAATCCCGRFAAVGPVSRRY